MHDTFFYNIDAIVVPVGGSGNVTGVHYEKGKTESVSGCYLHINMETRGFDHVELITRSLREADFKLA